MPKTKPDVTFKVEEDLAKVEAYREGPAKVVTERNASVHKPLSLCHLSTIYFS